MAARLDPGNVQPMRQSLHHLVAKAPWRDETLLDEVRNHVLPAMQKQGPVVAWIVDDRFAPSRCMTTTTLRTTLAISVARGIAA